MPKVYGIIPARFDSSRFPGKPLVDLKGKPMIQRVWEQALKAKSLDGVAIATDDKRIAAVAEAFGAEVVMTPKNCPSGSDRVGLAAKKLGAKAADIVVNIQGDEPLLPPAMINQLVQLLKSKKKAVMATLGHELKSRKEWLDPNIVKIVCSDASEALYFSRAAIPYDRDSKKTALPQGLLRHIGIYAYRVGFLGQMLKKSPTKLEKTEKLEQLRVLEMGQRILVGRTKLQSLAVDTPADAQKIRKLL